jgi:GNAT superfamily N-acetyltransferase
MDRRMTIAVRSLAATDADAIVGMHDAFMAYLEELGDPDAALKHFTVDRYLADGFGPDPVFAGYIAEDGGAPCGYLLYCKGYNVDLAYRLFFVCDLWVQPGTRGKGIGRALVKRCAADCRTWGGEWLEWYVYRPNKMAFEFYRRLGGLESDALTVMTLKADAL